MYEFVLEFDALKLVYTKFCV